MTRVRVVGIGQPDRGDDAAGLLAADAVRAQAPGADVRSGAADAAGVLAQFEGADRVIVIDSARGGGAPGDVVRLMLSGGPDRQPGGLSLTGAQQRPLPVRERAIQAGGALADQPTKCSRAFSSHGNALAGALALGEALGCLPKQLSVFAIVGETFALGAPLSPAVRAALPGLVRQVMQEASCTKRD